MAKNEFNINKPTISNYEVAIYRTKNIQSEIEIIKSIIKNMEERFSPVFMDQMIQYASRRKSKIGSFKLDKPECNCKGVD